MPSSSDRSKKKYSRKCKQANRCNRQICDGVVSALSAQNAFFKVQLQIVVVVVVVAVFVTAKKNRCEMKLKPVKPVM